MAVVEEDGSRSSFSATAKDEDPPTEEDDVLDLCANGSGDRRALW